MGRLERQLDLDIVYKIQGGWTPRQDHQPLKKQKKPRAAHTYRAARRNLFRSVARGMK